MKPLRRKLFTGLAAISLLQCVMLTALWLRSYFVAEALFRSRWYANPQSLSRIESRSSDGEMTIYYERMATPAQGGFFPPENIDWQHSTRRALPHFWWRIRHQPREYFMGANGTLKWSESWTIEFRIWPLAAIAAILPAFWLIKRKRDTRLATPDICPTCGYDLRATPNRCPECGTIPQIQAKFGL